MSDLRARALINLKYCNPRSVLHTQSSIQSLYNLQFYSSTPTRGQTPSLLYGWENKFPASRHNN